MNDRSVVESNNSPNYKLLASLRVSPCPDHPCINQYCLNYHSALERRRNPYSKHTFLYAPLLCNGPCKGDDCPFCLTQSELDFHPLNYKIEKCAQYKNCMKGFCPRFHEYDRIHEGDLFYRFDLNTFKTQHCMLNYHHDLKICLNYHTTKDRRRPMLNYQHVICENHNNCPLEDSCPFAHNKIQQLYHPSRYKSKFCQKYPNNIHLCEYQDFCSFAHYPKEITISLIHLLPQDRSFFINQYKTIWCPFTRDHERNKCVYAHNIQDFRRNPNEFKYDPENCPSWKTAENIKSIEQAGCKDMMNCSKCHGRKELEYHPLIYKAKNDKNTKFPHYTRDKINHKHETASKEEFCEKKRMENNYQQVMPNMIGAPFFQYDNKSVSSKTTRARSGGTYRNTDCNKVKKRKESVDSCSSKPEFSYKDSYHCIYGSDDGEKELFQMFDRPQRTSEYGPEKKLERARSESQKDKDFRMYYSQEVTDILQDTNILEKLAYHRITEVKILNMDDKSIMGISWLSSAEKQVIVERLRSLQGLSVLYSSQLNEHFRAHKKVHILDKLRSKRVREKKLLTMQAEEIQMLSFMEDEEKKHLPLIIKDFVDSQEFFDLNNMINREVSDAVIFQ